jgi:hypothetical protein
MSSIFMLWYVAPGTDDDDGLLIGAYSSEEDARAAINRLQAKPGFAEAPDGFQIHALELNKDRWTEGFVITD